MIGWVGFYNVYPAWHSQRKNLFKIYYVFVRVCECMEGGLHTHIFTLTYLLFINILLKSCYVSKLTLFRILLNWSLNLLIAMEIFSHLCLLGWALVACGFQECAISAKLLNWSGLSCLLCFLIACLCLHGL